MFAFEGSSRTSVLVAPAAAGSSLSKVEICSEVCMNETYPNISGNARARVRGFLRSFRRRVAAGKRERERDHRRGEGEVGRERARASPASEESPWVARAAAGCSTATRPVRAGSLERACVRTVCNCHSPRGTPHTWHVCAGRDISVRAGKCAARGGDQPGNFVGRGDFRPEILIDAATRETRRVDVASRRQAERLLLARCPLSLSLTTRACADVRTRFAGARNGELKTREYR